MWDGPRPGPRGPPFRGDSHGERFDAPKRPFPDFGGTGKMPYRPMERPPPDIRFRHEHPGDGMGRDFKPMDLRGRDPRMDFPRRDKPEFGMRRRPEMGNRFRGPPDFRGPPMHHLDNSRRDGEPMHMGEFDEPNVDLRERHGMGRPEFSTPPVDSRRRLPLEILGREGHGLNMRGNDKGGGDLWNRNRPWGDMDGADGSNKDLPQKNREFPDFKRQGIPPVNLRGGRFDTDMDLRDRRRPPSEYMERERSPVGFRNNDGVPFDARGRGELPPDFGEWNGPNFRGGDGNYREQREPPMGFRNRDEPIHSQDIRERGPFPMEPHMKGGPPFPKGRDRFPQTRGPERTPRGTHDFQGREGGPMDFPGAKEGPYTFPPPERETLGSQPWKSSVPLDNFIGRDLPPFEHRGLLETPLMHTDPPPINSTLGEEPKGGPRDQEKNGSFREKPPYFVGADSLDSLPVMDSLSQEHHSIEDRSTFPEPKEAAAGPEREETVVETEKFMDKRSNEYKDQDYRDIDYRLASSHTFDYEHGEPQGLEKTSKPTKPVPPPRSSDFSLQDQDYRSASIKEKVSQTISITGIPKTATMEQILSAFAVRDGVPIPGMKIKAVVPGYSYDTAYVEFLNLEDAVHFMESNQGALKIGSKTVMMQYAEPDWNGKVSAVQQESQVEEPQSVEVCPPAPAPPEPQPLEPVPEVPGSQHPPGETESQTDWLQQPQDDASWQESMEQQPAESWGTWNSRPAVRSVDPIFKESKTMIIKNVKCTSTVESILKALDPFAYLDMRNVRLVKGKPVGSKCFCFVDMDSHEQVVHLVELLTKPQPLIIDGARVHVEVARPLKNQSFKKDFEKPSLLGYPDLSAEYYPQPLPASVGTPAVVQGETTVAVSGDATLSSDLQLQTSHLPQGTGLLETPATAQPYQTTDPHASAAITPAVGDGSDAYSYDAVAPDVSTYLYDATSGFYYDPQTTLYYDPNSRYFYNAQTQQYLYWDSVRKDYVPVPGHTAETQPPSSQTAAATVTASAVVPQETPQDTKATGSEGAVDKKEEDMVNKPEKKEKDDKPRSLAAHKIMKDMERWAKIQNRQKESIRAPSPVLKPQGNTEEKKASKAADAAFAIFERKGTADDIFKKPFAPPKKEEKALKRPLGSLGMLVSEYGAGSDEEEEEERKEEPRAVKSHQEKEDRLTDWKKMACLLCRRQFPNKDALVRHQKLSDLHKQNMEIHLKIKRSKKELEALESQEREMSSRDMTSSPTEAKRRKYQSSDSLDVEKGVRKAGGVKTNSGEEESFEKKKRGSETQVRTPATYREAVRKAMFARYKELE
nr:PREDICTED: RNA-binding protein 10-like isoform X1 [Lepisosteus oculatus]